MPWCMNPQRLRRLRNPDRAYGRRDARRTERVLQVGCTSFMHALRRGGAAIPASVAWETRCQREVAEACVHLLP